MVICYASRKLEKTLNSNSACVQAFGKVLAKKLIQRLRELAALTNLHDARTLSGANCHELTGDRKGEIAMSLTGNYRLILRPNHAPIPQKTDGGLDWTKVTIVEIIEIADYH
jgi:plasmid maintenance system killer protein